MQLFWVYWDVYEEVGENDLNAKFSSNVGNYVAVLFADIGVPKFMSYL